MISELEPITKEITMTMHYSYIQVASTCEITIDAPYGDTLMLKVYENDSEAAAVLDVQQAMKLIEELSQAVRKCHGYEIAKNKESYIERINEEVYDGVQGV